MEAKHTATPNYIRIGHPAYTGANRVQWTNSKPAAIAILRDRGVKRDEARKALQRALAKQINKYDAYGEVLRGGDFGSDIVELTVFDAGFIL